MTCLFVLSLFFVWELMSKSFCISGLLAWFCLSAKVLAKTNQPLFEDPFDVGGGGAILTRATGEGMLFANPALLPYGGVFWRWLGMQTTLSPGTDSLNITDTLGGGEAEGEAGQSEEEANNSFVDSLFSTPLHLGVAQSFSLLTNNGGLAVFASAEPDFRAWRRGDPEKGAGTPTMVLHNEVYGGAVASFASRSIFDSLSLGLTFKYLIVDEKRVAVDVTDQAAISDAKNELGSISSVASSGRGMGFDFGSLYFAQGALFDFRLAATVTNVGGVSFSSSTPDLKQMINAGVGFTIHSTVDALHFSADLRDVTNEHGEELFKRLYLGTKIMFRQLVGISSGLYHGTPSIGAEIDFYLFRLAVTSYTREYGAHPGVDPRPIYMGSFSMGFDF